MISRHSNMSGNPNNCMSGLFAVMQRWHLAAHNIHFALIMKAKCLLTQSLHRFTPKGASQTKPGSNRLHLRPYALQATSLDSS